MMSTQHSSLRPITADDLSRRDEALIQTVEEMLQREHRGGWHLDKKVPISIILTLLLQAAAGLWFVAGLRTDIELLKSSTAVQRERDDRQDKTLADALGLIRADLQKANDKLDRLIEKGAQR
jgi:hypothetical protein